MLEDSEITLNAFQKVLEKIAELDKIPGKKKGFKAKINTDQAEKLNRSIQELKQNIEDLIDGKTQISSKPRRM